jgi:hypothetical protein
MISLLDNVRTSVLAILAKESRGYLTPMEFNKFAHLAQLEVFEEYFEEYTNWISKSLVRRTHSEYADMPKYLREKIDIFSEYGQLTYANGLFSCDNCHRVNTVTYNNDEVEEVYKSQLPYLLMSDLTAPSSYYPVYIKLGKSIEIHPLPPIIDSTKVKAYYIRQPLEPNWTYITTGGELDVSFNMGDENYRDFEVHPSDEYKLVAKILTYAGLALREPEVNKIIQDKKMIDNQITNR